MITHSRYRQRINMTYLFQILTKWLFHFPSIYCYQKIAAPNFEGALFLTGYSGDGSEGLCLGECFCWTSFELKNHFNMIDWYSRRIYWWNESLASSWNVPKIPRECGERCSTLVQSSTIHQENAMVIFGVFISGNDISESYVFAKEVFQGLCFWVRISTI